VLESRWADEARAALEKAATLAAASATEAKRRYLAEVLEGLPPIRRRLLYIQPHEGGHTGTAHRDLPGRDSKTSGRRCPPR
jgi:hypothetical protein